MRNINAIIQCVFFWMGMGIMMPYITFMLAVVPTIMLSTIPLEFLGDILMLLSLFLLFYCMKCMDIWRCFCCFFIYFFSYDGVSAITTVQQQN